MPTPDLAELRLSLNGQQLSVDLLNFTFYAARISSYAPTSGPTDGGTMLNVRGASLRLPGAAEDNPDVPLARCAFGSITQTPATWVGGTSDADGYLQCETPSMKGSPSTAVRFSISLNGQDLTADTPPCTLVWPRSREGIPGFHLWADRRACLPCC